MNWEEFSQLCIRILRKIPFDESNSDINDNVSSEILLGQDPNFQRITTNWLMFDQSPRFEIQSINVWVLCIFSKTLSIQIWIEIKKFDLSPLERGFCSILLQIQSKIELMEFLQLYFDLKLKNLIDSIS